MSHSQSNAHAAWSTASPSSRSWIKLMRAARSGSRASGKGDGFTALVSRDGSDTVDMAMEAEGEDRESTDSTRAGRRPNDSTSGEREMAWERRKEEKVRMEKKRDGWGVGQLGQACDSGGVRGAARMASYSRLYTILLAEAKVEPHQVRGPETGMMSSSRRRG